MARRSDLLERANPRGFSARKRQRFLEALELTCAITKAARYAGVSYQTVYNRRRNDEVFARQWEEALASGVTRLEAMVLEKSGAGLALPSDPEAAAAAVGTEFSLEAALKVLNYRRGMVAAGGKPVGNLRNATRAETTAALLKSLDIARKRAARRVRND